MEKLLTFITKLSICLLILIAIEGFITFGSAFDFENYGVISITAQVCLLNICIFVSTKDWRKD